MTYASERDADACPAEDRLLGYSLGDLPDETFEAISLHAETCILCQDRLERFDNASDDLVSRLRDLTLSPPVTDVALAQALVAADELAERLFAASADLDAAPLIGEGLASGEQHSAVDPLIGKAFGSYQLLEKIGQGGMGTVYRAWHKRLKRAVAFKVITCDRLTSAVSISRFGREVEAAGKLIHPHVVATYDAGEQDGLHYLVMEYVEGSTLASVVTRRGPLAVEAAVGCAIQAAQGLEHAHDQGVVHRDVKPSNLLLDLHGTVKILDMGLARLQTLALEPDAHESLTAAGSILGTIDYMSPEQAADTRQADERSDIYSLGCTLYFLLTGRRLYEVGTTMQRLLCHREAAIPRLRKARGDVSAELENVFQKMVAKRAKDRFQSMRETRAALEAACPHVSTSLDDTIQGLPGNPHATAARAGDHRRPWPLGRWRLACAGLALAVIAAGIGIMWSRDFAPPPRPATNAQERPASPVDSRASAALGSNTAVEVPGAETRTDASAERRAAQWVLSIGGKIGILSAGASAETLIADVADLPKQDFVLTKVDLLENKRLIDRDLKNLEGLGQLRDLRLEATPLTNAGLAHLEHLFHLTRLNISTTQVSDAGFAHLRGLTRLTTLQLGNLPGITDTGIAQIEHLVGVSYLSLANTRVTDRTLARLEALAQLKTLYINKTSVTDAGLSELQHFPLLSDLDLSQTKITDAGLPALYSLPNLTRVRLTKVALHDEALAKLRAALPSCAVMQ